MFGWVCGLGSIVGVGVVIPSTTFLRPLAIPHYGHPVWPFVHALQHPIQVRFVALGAN